MGWAWPQQNEAQLHLSTARVAHWKRRLPPKEEIMGLSRSSSIIQCVRLLRSLRHAWNLRAQSRTPYKRAAPGIEPGTSRTRSKNPASRPSSQLDACPFFFRSFTPDVFHDFCQKAQRIIMPLTSNTLKTTPVGFEPTRGDPIGLAGRRLNRSAIVSLLQSAMK